MHNNNSFKYMIILMLLMGSVSLFAQDAVVNNSEMPEVVVNYLKTHFPDHNVIKFQIEVKRLIKEYELKLDDGTKIEFNNKLEVIKVESNSKLPDSVIPEKLKNYVKANFPNSIITQWEIEWKHQEIKLNNGLELEFTIDGEFIRID